MENKTCVSVSVLLAMSQIRAKNYYFIASKYDKSFHLIFLKKCRNFFYNIEKH